MNRSLDAHQRDRYSRQLAIDAFDEAAQRALLSSRVLVVGVGGLGSAAVQYLAAAGVGTLRIADHGTVKRSNLQRQVIHGTDDIGEPKVDSAARFIETLDPETEVECRPERVDANGVESLLKSVDVVVDGLDTFQGRFIVNDAARLAGVPFVHGAIYAFEGQYAVFRPGGPCYRCLLPEAPDPETVPSGEPIGVFSTLPGVVGCLQATEALKILAGVGTPLEDRVVRCDATDATFVDTPLEQDPDCPVCGPDPITSVTDGDYEGDCRIER